VPEVLDRPAVLVLGQIKHGIQQQAGLLTRRELAAWTGGGGGCGRARDQYAALLPVQERVVGTKHPSALTIFSGGGY
jgi:hypothetical protein